MLPPFGDFRGLDDRGRRPVIAASRGRPVSAGTIAITVTRSVGAATPLVFCVVDDWFIRPEIRQPMLDANATVKWEPPQYSQRMDDWLQHLTGHPRKRYFGCRFRSTSASAATGRDRSPPAGGARRFGSRSLQGLHRPD